jgi:hypothetical protein
MEYKEFGVQICANNLEIGYSPLTNWMKESKDEDGIQVVALVFSPAMTKRRMNYLNVNTKIHGTLLMY